MTEIIEFITSAFNTFILVMKDFRIIDAIDIVFVAFIIYKIIQFVRQTRAKQLLGGTIILLLVWLIAEWLEMTTMSVLLKALVNSGILVLVILFQPELRNALELVSRSNLLFSKKTDLVRTSILDCIDNVCSSCDAFQKSKTGALMVFERTTMLEDVAKTGTIIDSKVQKELLCNIFYPNTPLHDGAVIIRGEKIYSAACILPLSQSNRISKALGTRHRAALGISENSDAVVVVVSEETGTISVAEHGALRRNFTPQKLREHLMTALLPAEDSQMSKLAVLKSKLFKGGKNNDEKAE